ncbi:TetR/AcrR family transcriptional regulator [Actinoalloteichus hymeniacidonis]|uniref:Transcriptional regulator, TetR family n=1 Tax=Actinoalloteichus hymeniacidonis TaxID=340345 RepID=A0AAC9N0K6_9PSEU|nr:TetR/AcrR family transcriptional regulator [Actinoalloteichus hymeniacidonis]AOS64996.1 transcriptional regulator, TetR family [Actinoalloteichus hymeniacidonis]MBB5906928.1 AcrR family transcriptional regulator [Actinoalloteichus hymeniacidonis]
MNDKARRAPTGAAVLQPQTTAAISEGVLDELAANGYARLSMEAVAKRAGVGKSALYRRWPSKQDMVFAVLAESEVTALDASDTGSLRGDLLASLRETYTWLVHPRYSGLLPDLTAEAIHDPTLSEAVENLLCHPRRELGAIMLRRAIDRGELPDDVNIEIALDLIGAPLYWRVSVRQAPIEPDYLEQLVDHLLRALGARVDA